MSVVINQEVIQVVLTFIPSIPIIVGIQGPPGSPGIGDMTKAVYDVDDDGVVDETEKVDGGVW